MADFNDLCIRSNEITTGSASSRKRARRVASGYRTEYLSKIPMKGYLGAC